jgi:hypothetical protein
LKRHWLTASMALQTRPQGRQAGARKGHGRNQLPVEVRGHGGVRGTES